MNIPKSVASTPAVVIAFIIAIAACQGAAPPAPAETPGGECSTIGSRHCTDATDCGPSGVHCTGGSCFANQAGCPCSDVADCGSNAHCAKGTCYENRVGVPCSAAEDCGPHAHCTAGGCYANNTGSPCAETSDCGAGSACVRGMCN